LQGDIIAIYNEDGVKIGSYTYDAWGNFTVAQTAGISELDALVLNTYNPFRYRGYFYDVETGLYYLQSRYYNPQWGRFINADAFVSTGTGILGYNMFAYCNNNPVMYTDSTGNNWFTDWWEDTTNAVKNAWETWTEKSFIYNAGKAIIQNLSADAGLSIGAGGALTVGVVEVEAISRMDVVGVSASREGVVFGNFGKSAASIGINAFSKTNGVFQLGRESNTYESFDGTIREILPDKTDFSLSFGQELAIFLGFHYQFSFSISGAISDYSAFISNWR